MMSKIEVTARFKIHDGRLEDFKRLAAQCLASVKEKDSGTHQYDWFMNSDQTECAVRETYESSEAVMSHAGNLGALIPALLETADFSLEVFGSPSNDVKEAFGPFIAKEYAFMQGL